MNTFPYVSFSKTKIAAVVLILSAMALRGAEFVDIIEKNFPITKGGQLTTELSDANITVSSHDEPEVYVHITRTVTGRSEDEAKEIFAKHLIEFEAEADSLTIVTKREDKKSKIWRFRRGNFEVNFQIRVPRKLNTNLKTVDGDVSVAGVEGTSTIHTVDGDLVVRDISGELKLKTVDGDAEISNLVGPLEVRSVDGDLTLKQIHGSIQAKTIDGDVELELAASPESSSNIESMDGDIELTIGEGIGATIDAKASDGTVHLPYIAETVQKRGDSVHIVARAHGGGPTIVLRTRDGDIVAH